MSINPYNIFMYPNRFDDFFSSRTADTANHIWNNYTLYDILTGPSVRKSFLYCLGFEFRKSKKGYASKIGKRKYSYKTNDHVSLCLIEQYHIIRAMSTILELPSIQVKNIHSYPQIQACFFECIKEEIFPDHTIKLYWIREFKYRYKSIIKEINKMHGKYKRKPKQ